MTKDENPYENPYKAVGYSFNEIQGGKRGPLIMELVHFANDGLLFRRDGNGPLYPVGLPDVGCEMMRAEEMLQNPLIMGTKIEAGYSAETGRMAWEMRFAAERRSESIDKLAGMQ
ncbi:hypothetical protein J4470_01565 [Candidatus Woesearchaeota archaeon]|nr:hypothetical protein [Candidatus Woesearchaeota archaeon]